MLIIGTLNTPDDRIYVLAQTIRSVERGGFDIILLVKTKIQKEAYSHIQVGYDRICSVLLPSKVRGSQGGVRYLVVYSEGIWFIPHYIPTYNE